MTPEEFHAKFPDMDEINVGCTVDYACPHCGSRGPFFVEVRDFVELSDEGGYSVPYQLEETFAPNTECMDCKYVGGNFIVEGLDDYLAKLSEASDPIA